MSKKSNSFSSRRCNQKQVTILETTWGFVIQKGTGAKNRAFWGEILALAGILAFGAAAYGQWLWPVSEQGFDLVPFKIGATVMFFVLAAWLYFIARNGLITEVQVDTDGRSVGVVRRNREGNGYLESLVKFEEVESLYIKRTKIRRSAGELFINVRGGFEPLLLADAPTVELEPLLARLREVCLKPALTVVSNTSTDTDAGTLVA